MEKTCSLIWEDLRPPGAGKLGFNNRRNRTVYVKTKVYTAGDPATSRGYVTATTDDPKEQSFPVSNDTGIVGVEVLLFWSRTEAEKPDGTPFNSIGVSFPQRPAGDVGAESQLVFTGNPAEHDLLLIAYRDPEGTPVELDRASKHVGD